MSLESLLAGAFAVPLAGAVLPLRQGEEQTGRPGSKTRAKKHWGFPGTWEILSSPPAKSAAGGGRTQRTPGSPPLRLGRWERSQAAPSGTVGRRKPSPREGRQEVAPRHSTVEAGELASEEPVEGRARPTGGSRGGNQGKHIEASNLVPGTSRVSFRGVQLASVEVKRLHCKAVR